MFLLLLLSVDALAAPRAVVLEEASVHATPALDGKPVQRLPAGTVVEAVAIGTVPTLVPGEDWHGVPPVFIRENGRTGWLHGQHLAIEQAWDGPGFWPGERIAARTVGNVAVWSAARTAREWNEQNELWDRVEQEGWVVFQPASGPARPVPWTHSNGWGSSRYAEQLVWRDISGDGVTDVLVVFQETITEVGNDAQTLELWDLTRGPDGRLAAIEVFAPTWTGLDTHDRFGTVDVTVDAGPLVIRRSVLEVTASPDDGEQTLQQADQTWTWQDGRLVANEAERSMVRARLDAGSVYSDRTGEHIEDHPGGPVCADRIAGPLGIGTPPLVRIQPCSPGDGIRGWVEGERLHLDHPVHAELFGTGPESPTKAVRFDWDR